MHFGNYAFSMLNETFKAYISAADNNIQEKKNQCNSMTYEHSYREIYEHMLIS